VSCRTLTNAALAACGEKPAGLGRGTMKAGADSACNRHCAKPASDGRLPTRTCQWALRGGWTGPGGKVQFAGYVHADEYVQPKAVQEPAPPGVYGAVSPVRHASGCRGYAEGGASGPRVAVFATCACGQHHTPPKAAHRCTEHWRGDP